MTTKVTKRCRTPIERCIEHVSMFEASGMTKKAYCESKDLNVKTFYRWQRRVRLYQGKKSKPDLEHFTRVKTHQVQAAPTSKQALEVVLADQTRLRFPDIVDAQVISNLIKVLQPCN